jgi:ferredoxin
VPAKVSSRNRVAIEVDRALCYGFGDCVDTAPKVFALDEEDVSIVIDPDGEPLDVIVEAAQNCPVDAIVLTDEDGRQIYP